MEKHEITRNGSGQYAHKGMSRWEMRFLFVVASILSIFVAGTMAAHAMTKEIDVKNVIVETPPQQIQEEAPVLQRIADCESGIGKKGTAHQFNKDGTIVMHENANGSIDIGYMQINLTVAHINAAAKMKMDLTTEEGNKAFGKWIYENEGTDPWNSSSKCWK